jgi:2-amino-4-hydroxy-6-hydroxymethyldihydropteridine diphosphokinase
LTEEHSVYLGLGSNLGDRPANLAEARRQLSAAITVTATSSIVETEPWGFTDQPPFLNQVVSGFTDLAADALLESVKAIERRMGRRPSFRYGPRLIDIDILVYDQLQMEAEHLALPHPRLTERAFVLIPLDELAPGLRIPGTGLTVAEWVSKLDEPMGVVAWTPEEGDE